MLSEDERKILNQYRNIRNSGISERCLYVLLSDEGKSVTDIAGQTKRNEHTVRFRLKQYRKGGTESLKGVSPPGRPPEKSVKIYPIILEIVPDSPTEYGYIGAGRTVNMITDYLKKEGMGVGAGTVKRVLKKTVGFIKDSQKQFLPALRVMRKKEKGLKKLLRK